MKPRGVRWAVAGVTLMRPHRLEEPLMLTHRTIHRWHRPTWNAQVARLTTGYALAAILIAADHFGKIIYT